MRDTDLFQLGIGLETGAQAEDFRHTSAPAGAEERPGQVLCDPARDDHFVRAEDGQVYAGTHLIIEVVGGVGLDDPGRIETAFRDCVRDCGATLLHIHTHRFSPQGVSGVAVLAESHISVHTWPEAGYGAFDVFMCGDAVPWHAVGVLEAAFETRDVRVTELLRGAGVVSCA